MIDSNKKQLAITSAKQVAFIGVMAATIECAKLVLAVLPNIEVVTILCALYGYTFGIYGIWAAVIFVCIEPLIWGLGSWVITYALYWPLVAFIFMILSKRRVKNRIILTLSAVGLTIFFGLLSAVVDTAFFVGINEYYFKNILIYYLRGIGFYATQIATNAVLFPTLFLFLVSKLTRIRSMMRI